MNLRDDDVVSAVALVMETNTPAQIQGDLGDEGEELLSDVPAVEGEAPSRRRPSSIRTRRTSPRRTTTT